MTSWQAQRAAYFERREQTRPEKAPRIREVEITTEELQRRIYEAGRRAQMQVREKSEDSE